MAWGELLYDHTDIFAAPPPEPPPPRGSKRKRDSGRPSPTWEDRIMRRLADGSSLTEIQIRRAFGLTARNGQLYKTLRAMATAGKLVREFRGAGRHAAWHYRCP